MSEAEANTSSEFIESAEKKIMEFEERFWAFSDAASKEGVLSYKMKQLIATAIGVVKGCERCVRAHALHALEAGASGEEVVEACFIAVQMDGGPSYARLRDMVLKVIKDYQNGYRYHRPFEANI